VIVQQVTRRNNQIIVQAEFKQPVPGEGRTLGYTSPYQLIAVSKDARWEPVTQVELIVSGETVAKATHSIQ
jgi:hypothetical protein